MRVVWGLHVRTPLPCTPHVDVESCFIGSYTRRGGGRDLITPGRLVQ